MIKEINSWDIDTINIVVISTLGSQSTYIIIVTLS
jgi:hypothetical protein